MAKSAFTRAHVSSHAPVRGHPESHYIYPSHNCFKSCPREGASAASCPSAACASCFKSCPREGASRELASGFETVDMFQVMPP